MTRRKTASIGESIVREQAERLGVPPGEHRADLVKDHRLDELRHAARMSATVDELLRRAGAEVDLLLEYGGVFYPIEMKAKTHLNGHDARGIIAFRKTYPGLNIGTGLILCPGKEDIPRMSHLLEGYGLKPGQKEADISFLNMIMNHRPPGRCRSHWAFPEPRP